MSIPKFVNMTKNIPFFPILHVFAPLNDERTYIAWSWKTTLITWIFLRGWYPVWNTSGPPGDLIMMIVVDKTEHDIYKVTFTAYSSNNGDISTFIFCRAYCIIGIKQWESKRIIRTLLLEPWLWVTYQKAHIHLKTGNKITKREWKPPIDFYTKWALELGHGYSPLTSWGCDLFPTPSFICLSENLSKTIGGKLVGFSSVKDVDLIQCNLKSVSIFSYHWLFFG